MTCYFLALAMSWGEMERAFIEFALHLSLMSPTVIKVDAQKKKS